MLKSVKQYILYVLIAIDQLFNALLLGAPDETLSSRAYRAEQSGKVFGKLFRPLIDLLFFFDKQHCYNAYISEVKKRQLPAAFSN
jgi:hypothetical protein